MYTEPVDIRYYPPQHVQFRKKAYEIMKEFAENPKWSQYGTVGYADIIDIAREDEFGTAILRTDMPYLSSDWQAEELGEIFDMAIPGGSSNALFLFGLPKNKCLEASGFELMNRVCSDNLIAGFYESEIEEAAEDCVLKVVCICTLKQDERAAYTDRNHEMFEQSAVQAMLQENFYNSSKKIEVNNDDERYSVLSGSEENHYVTRSGKLTSALKTGYKRLRLRLQK